MMEQGENFDQGYDHTQDHDQTTHDILREVRFTIVVTSCAWNSLQGLVSLFSSKYSTLTLLPSHADVILGLFQSVKNEM